MQNYRQFRNQEIVFNKNPDNDLHIIIGIMGTGKTNLLNAFNWVLYGDEPYLSKELEQLPVLNLMAIEEAENSETQDVVIEMWVETEDKQNIVFTRRSIYRVHKSDKEIKMPSHQDHEFEVRFTDNAGNTKIDKNEEAYPLVEQFIPKGIREFFFFDGERLDKYFREATGQNIKNAIFEISQLKLLTQVSSNVRKIKKELEKEASRQNPKINKAMEERDRIKEALELRDIEIEQCHSEIRTAKGKANELGGKLGELPNVNSLESKRSILLENRKEAEDAYDSKTNEKKDFLFGHSNLILLWPAINKVSLLIKAKKETGELPPTIDRSLIEKIKLEKICVICGHILDAKAEIKINELLKRIKLSREIGQQLMPMEVYIFMFDEQIKKFKNKLKKITDEIRREEKTLTEIEKEINDIDSKLFGYDLEKIKSWAEQRQENERIYDEQLERLGVFKKKRKELEDELKQAEENFRKEVKKEEKSKKVKKQIDFCEQVLNVADKTKNDILNKIREEIETKTKNTFLNLNWRHGTFKDVKIGKDYCISVIHTMGYECLGSISGGERELLTLAFTIGLHEVSGFDAPIIVDRPLAMVSGESREKIVNVFAKISKNKQTILFFTPNDYSSEIAEILDFKATSRMRANILSNEKEVQMEVL